MSSRSVRSAKITPKQLTTEPPNYPSESNSLNSLETEAVICAEKNEHAPRSAEARVMSCSKGQLGTNRAQGFPEEVTTQGCCLICHLVFLYMLSITAVVLVALVVLGKPSSVCTDNGQDPQNGSRTWTRQHVERELHNLWTAVNRTIRDLHELENKELQTLRTTLQEISVKVSELKTTIDGMASLGNNASEGPTGPQGPQGVPGYNGSDGFPGSTGPTGPQGPQGVPGYNGSRGPPGITGSIGPRGSGNMTMCQYKKASSDGVTPGDVSVAEPVGKRIIGATCSTDGAGQYVLTSVMFFNIQYYKCQCKGTSTLFTPAGRMHCYLHYWECPLIS